MGVFHILVEEKGARKRSLQGGEAAVGYTRVGSRKRVNRVALLLVGL